MWVLLMNDMRWPKIEMKQPVLRGETREQILAFLERQKATVPWQDGQWGKVFQQGSVLEWFNPPYDFDLERDLFEVPSVEETIEMARQRHVKMMQELMALHNAA